MTLSNICYSLRIVSKDFIYLQTKLVDTHFEWDIHFWLGKETSQVCY